MGVQDRDWWRERRDNLHPDDPRSWGRRRESAASRRPLKRWQAWLIWLLIVLGVVAAYLQWIRREAPPSASAAKSARNLGATASCDDPLTHGAWIGKLESGSDVRAKSRTEVVNGTARDRVLDLLLGDKPIMSIALPAGKAAALEVPVGSYQWRLRHGAAWCSRQQQFVREVRVNISQPLEIVARSRLTIHLEDDASQSSGLRIRTADEPIVSVSGSGADTAFATMRPDGVYLLRRSDRGHYLIDGSIDGVTMPFMIDTGATMVAIPEAIAHRLGHYRGREIVTETANGRATGYEFIAREIQFGPFVVQQVRVVALPNLSQPLLGMSVLGAMSMRQTPQGLALSTRP